MILWRHQPLTLLFFSQTCVCSLFHVENYLSNSEVNFLWKSFWLTLCILYNLYIYFQYISVSKCLYNLSTHSYLLSESGFELGLSGTKLNLTSRSHGHKHSGTFLGSQITPAATDFSILDCNYSFTAEIFKRKVMYGLINSLDAQGIITKVISMSITGLTSLHSLCHCYL